MKNCSEINLLLMGNIFYVTKLKRFADDKLNVVTMTISLFARVETTMGKGENAAFNLDKAKILLAGKDLIKSLAF